MRGRETELSHELKRPERQKPRCTDELLVGAAHFFQDGWIGFRSGPRPRG